MERSFLTRSQRAPLSAWLDSDWACAQLLQRGLSPKGTQAKAQLFERCAQLLIEAGERPETPAVAAYCPGRLEVFGKHTDYAGGRSLIAAPELGIAMLATERTGGEVTMHSAQAEHPWTSLPAETCVGLVPGQDAPPMPAGWALYPATVWRRLVSNFGRSLQGAHLACASDLPLAAGMSSSSALLTATLLVLSEINALADRPDWRAALPDLPAWAMWASCVENGQSFGPFAGDRGVGTFGGSEDHTAMLCSEPNTLGQFRFAPIHRERSWTLPRDWVFVVADSGVAAEKTAGAMESYNRLSQVAAALAAQADRCAALEGSTSAAPEPATGASMSGSYPHLAAFLRADTEHLPRLRAHLLRQNPGPFTPEEFLLRLEQFHGESEVRIPGLPAPHLAGSREAWGQAAAASTRAAASALGNQVPQTLWLTQALLDAGAFAASPFGAGFGGSVWALCDRDRHREVLQRLRAQAACTEIDAGLARGVEAARAIEIGPSAFFV